MTTALVLIVSGILIGAGISIVWRDLQKNRRRAFVLARDAPSSPDPEIEITISHGGDADARPSPPRPSTVTAPAVPPADTARAVSGASKRGRAEQGQEDASRQPFEQQWIALQPAIEAGVAQVNATLAPIRLAIAASGEPSWSYGNKGFGAYRRVLMADESVAWLRLELSALGRLHGSVKAHRDDRAELNAAADTPVQGLDEARASDLLSSCLKAAAGSRVRATPSREGDKETSEQAWQTVDAVVTAALKATNGALAQAGAKLLATTPATWEAELRRHRLTLAVEVDGDDVARMHIERLPHEMEVSVGVRDASLINLGRRRRIPIEGMSIHALAELIAGCAWPAIARFRENRRSA